jgi:hypothetical protein
MLLSTALVWGDPTATTASAATDQEPDTTALPFFHSHIGELHHLQREVQAELGVRAAGGRPVLRDAVEPLPELLDTPMGFAPTADAAPPASPPEPPDAPDAARRILLPEPGTFLLLSSGLMLTARAWRRRH